MNKLCSVLMVGALMSTVVGCAADNGNNARTNQYHGYQMGTNDTGIGNQGLNTTRSQASRNNGTTNITEADTEEFNGYFKDVAEKDWFGKNVEWANETGLMGGYPGGTFNPQKSLTRAEMATILRNLAEQGYIDVPDETDETPATDPTPDTTTPGDTDTTPDTTTPGGTDTTPDTTVPGGTDTTPDTTVPGGTDTTPGTTTPGDTDTTTTPDETPENADATPDTNTPAPDTTTP